MTTPSSTLSSLALKKLNNRSARLDKIKFGLARELQVEIALLKENTTRDIEVLIIWNVQSNTPRSLWKGRN
jgi:hypothetical protein